VILEGKRILIAGGTGSLGKALVTCLLTGKMGRPSKIIVFSRDEAKQHEMRLEYLQRWAATDEIIYQNSKELLTFRIGDIRDSSSLSRAVREADVVVNAAAMKQVPTCEYFPFEAVQTNIVGAQNLVRVIRDSETPPELVVGVSTDKACKPINVMGMTKAVQERLLIQANLECPRTRFVCVRYGNVIASRGSVVPLFLDQIREGGPVTITLKEMTRFLLSLDQAVNTILAAAQGALPGETYVPKVASASVVDIADVMINGRNIPVVYTGIRPGEKIHEILVSEEECYRTIEREGYFVICPILPELRRAPLQQLALNREFSSEHVTLDREALRTMLAPYMETEMRRIQA
jgi:UDP-glucose 4-epimerase